MSPIAPRYRGLSNSSDVPQTTFSPMISIPNLTPIEDAPSTTRELVDEDANVQLEYADVDTSRATGTDVDSGPPAKSDAQPAGGTMQESIKRITDSATQSLKKLGSNGTFNPIETIRGVLPGIVISISIICLWWIVGRDSPTPLRQDMAHEAQGEQESISPIANQPLRASNNIAKTTPHPSPAFTADAQSRDEQLFDRVPFINRPTNEAVSQTESTQPETSSTVPPADGPQAEARPAPSQSGSPPAQQPQIASRPQHRVPPDRGQTPDPRADADSRATQGRERLAQPSTEYEWSREGNSIARGTPPDTANSPVNESRRDRVAVQSRPREREAISQRIDPQQPNPSPGNYSYEQTDPATYKDPIYNVPPVARRARPAPRQR